MRREKHFGGEGGLRSTLRSVTVRLLPSPHAPFTRSPPLSLSLCPSLSSSLTLAASNAETKVVREVPLVSSDKRGSEDPSRARGADSAQNKLKTSPHLLSRSSFVNSSFQRQYPMSSFPYLTPRKNSATASRRMDARLTLSSHTFTILLTCLPHALLLLSTVVSAA